MIKRQDATHRSLPLDPAGLRTSKLSVVLVLAVDTATEACVAAVGVVPGPADEGGTPARVLASRTPVDARRHGELLAPLIREVLAEAGARPADLEGIVVGLGPGPFTSLRVGIVTAASLGDALGVRAVGVCTLDAIALAVPPDVVEGGGDIVVATDARRREVYWARYSDGIRLDGPSVERPGVLIEQIEGQSGNGVGVRVFGSGAALYPELGRRSFEGAPRHPDAAALLRLGSPALLLADEPGPLVPLYLRRPDAVPPGAPKASAQVSERSA